MLTLTDTLVLLVHLQTQQRLLSLVCTGGVELAGFPSSTIGGGRGLSGTEGRDVLHSLRDLKISKAINTLTYNQIPY